MGVVCRGVLLGVIVTLSACATPQSLESINDPYEAANRRTHEFNKGLDTALLKPAASVYQAAVPDIAAVGVSNLAKFVDVPSEVLNNVLQLDLAGAVKNSTRFVINGTVGVLGLYDAASEMGIYPVSADFGQTLNSWGVGEGNYLELPVIGPSTERDAVGIAVDAVLNPLTVLLPDAWKLTTTAVKSVAMIGDRARFGSTVESVLYESADSYSQSRLFYLQSRRHEVGMRAAEDDYLDPYEDPYAQ